MCAAECYHVLIFFLIKNLQETDNLKRIIMAGTVRKRLLEFCRRQQFRLKNRQQLIKIAIKRNSETRGLSVWFATLCVIDLFGVFPIIALPAALISCGKIIKRIQLINSINSY